ncbi:MAG: sigma-54-dependent Fis family transcriptional regulator [Acidobacteria bacterium]|nr:MAG: sigma-54-dependent Fis family transcriptional regulator [Acidobacteriota bacterium]
MPESILIAEDNPAQRVGLQQLIRSWNLGFDVDVAADGEEALQKVVLRPPTIILSDMVMPRMSGLELLKSVKQHDPSVTVVILTAQGSVETAVEAIKDGAYDYLMKPVDPQRLRIVIDQILDRGQTRREVESLKRRLRDTGQFGPMIGQSPEIKQVYHIIEQAGPTNASVLITGESGTGKELVAQAIHGASLRKHQPFVAINCAAIPDTLMESELFGHEKGSFTGALTRRQGCFELADRGTLFLDEIAEMVPGMQAKLLRALQERKFRLVGGTEEKTVDIRVIAATNLDPKRAIDDGKLREDLYYRLNVIGVHLPPLRERVDDIPLLVEAFIKEFAAANQKPVAGIDEAAMARLTRHRWPGNVRELRNVIERAVIITRGPMLSAADLPGLGDAQPAAAPEGPSALAPGMTVDEVERRLIDLTLASTGGNKTKAAGLLGISVKTLHNKLKAAGADAGTEHDG